MERDTMGRVTVEAVVENLQDLLAARHGTMADEAVRRVTIDDALVDTGATALSLPTSVIERLGIKRWGEKKVVTSKGADEAAIYEPVRLTIQDRHCSVDVIEVPDGVPALIGQVPLELLDFVVDLQSRRLIGNPAHGGEHVIEMF